ncbi:Co2+/Mg2+ efflux protein ApaG [Candidatus Entotheonella palauensis]|uniref:Co2+/Mg2+ efflux protein ApaG n=1 Tax=Candidatus Entotheonella palauensis TaxID=93172 RepID=UPI000B7D998C|nr:Co2+/Mg2+ efflux protein ApaG [Candidatus Entotheonella palauensis]
MSNVLTQGIRISVESFYVPSRSQPERGQYLFAYTVRIANEGDTPAQLISRHWIIQDAHGRTEHVRGPGVVGAQPRLEPGQSHEYTSFCPLGTPSGSMRGTYQMVRDDGSEFDAVVGVFSLMAPQLLN